MFVKCRRMLDNFGCNFHAFWPQFWSQGALETPLGHPWAPESDKVRKSNARINWGGIRVPFGLHLGSLFGVFF